MSKIVPAILPTSHEDLEKKLEQLHDLVDSVQIDIVDGRFVAPASWPYSAGTAEFKGLNYNDGRLSYLGQMHIEMDLMVADPEMVTGIWIDAGAERLTIHAESTKYLPKAVTDLEIKYGHSKGFAPGLLSIGLAINLTTETSMIERYLDHIDYVQFMGIATIGRQGEPFDARVLRKISAFKRKYPGIPIQVDGGVSLETAPLLVKAGVDRLIVGSALWRAADLGAELEKFNALYFVHGGY